MKRHELMDLIQEIQDRNYNKFVGTNEAELATREEICDLWEEEFKKVDLPQVINRRELLIDFRKWWNYNAYDYISDPIIDKYIEDKSINSL